MAEKRACNEPIEKVHVPIYIKLYKLHQDCHDYDAKQLREKALAYGIIVAAGTWGASFGGN